MLQWTPLYYEQNLAITLIEFVPCGEFDLEKQWTPSNPETLKIS